MPLTPALRRMANTYIASRPFWMYVEMNDIHLLSDCTFVDIEAKHIKCQI